MSTLEEQAERERQELDTPELEPTTGDEPDPATGDEPEPTDAFDPEPDPDEDPDAEPEPDPETEQADAGGLDPETFALMEERGKKLDKLGQYVARKLVEIFGEEEADELELCELCQWTHTFGWRVAQVPPEQVRDAVKRAIGLGTLDELKDYAAFQTCQTCGGLGNVRTGSQVTAHLYRQCPSCQGRGYSSSLDTDANRPAPQTPIAAMPTADGGPAVEADYDMFGTPAGHPDYGKLAQHREVPISHWSANLPQSS